ncbi:MAG: hypothetical protein IPO61_16640 [Gammaproteobacteria bacterium]|nr:hypothetical protein [Gammaproteobacteria bacterium]
MHEEDFLQALGPTYRDMNETQGGAVRAPARTDPHALQRSVAGSLKRLGAVAGIQHAGREFRRPCQENLSLLQTGVEQDARRTAPFYDLLCEGIFRDSTRPSPRCPVGSEFTPGDVTPTHWARFARDCGGFAGAGARRIVEDIRSLAERLPTLLDATRAAFEAEFGTAPALQQVEEVDAPAIAGGTRPSEIDCVPSIATICQAAGAAHRSQTASISPHWSEPGLRATLSDLLSVYLKSQPRSKSIYFFTQLRWWINHALDDEA